MDHFGFLEPTKLFPDGDFEHSSLFYPNECAQEEEDPAPGNKRRRCEESEEPQGENSEPGVAPQNTQSTVEGDCMYSVQPKTDQPEICSTESTQEHPRPTEPDRTLTECNATEPLCQPDFLSQVPKQVPALVIPEGQVTCSKPFNLLLFVPQCWFTATGITKTEVGSALRAAECHYDNRDGGPLSGRVDYCAQCMSEGRQTKSKMLVTVDCSAEQEARNPLMLEGGVLLFDFDRCRAGCRTSRVHLHQPLVLLAQLPHHELWGDEGMLPGGIVVSNPFVMVPRMNARKTARRWRLQGRGPLRGAAGVASFGKQMADVPGIGASAEEIELAKRLHWAQEQEREAAEATQAASKWVQREAVDEHKTYMSRGTFVSRGGPAPSGAVTGVVEEFTLRRGAGEDARPALGPRLCRGVPPSAKVLALLYSAMPPFTPNEYLESSQPTNDVGWTAEGEGEGEEEEAQ